FVMEGVTFQKKGGLSEAEITMMRKSQNQKPLYDITVQDNHNFFANGVLNHNCQVLKYLLEANEGVKCYIAEKIDGTSTTMFLKDGEFGVCSRSLQLAPDHRTFHETPKNIFKREDGSYEYLDESGTPTGRVFNELVRPRENAYWKTARQYKVEERLKAYGK